MSKMLFIDMDGTLCRFHDSEHKYIEAMWTPGFYIGLKPFDNLVSAISQLIKRNPDTQVYILSAVLDTEPPFAEAEKREWNHKYLPQIPNQNLIFVPAGADKSQYIGEINADCVLIDDYNKNLRQWERAGGVSIKFINDINNRGLGAYGGEKGGLWDGRSVNHDVYPIELCKQIERHMGLDPITQQRVSHKPPLSDLAR